MSKSLKKILFAAGGTGGHLFPAQALAEQLRRENEGIELVFAGAFLSQNPYFEKKFPFHDITSMTPFRGSVIKAFKSLFQLLKGVVQSYRLLSKEKPVLVVGFGSYHAFPLLCAAFFKRIPLVLFESNAAPGKVIRLFSKKARLTGIYFPEAKNHLKGKSVAVEIPARGVSGTPFTKLEARKEMGLDLNVPTVLVFGGSQGAKVLNSAVVQLLSLLKGPFQLIHFTGDEETSLEVGRVCKSLSIPCYVKKFEPRMQMAWKAADVVICRAGAMTLSELLHFEVPGILIPYPFASDQHQMKNALFFETQVGGAVLVPQAVLNAETLHSALLPFLSKGSKKEECIAAIQRFKKEQKKANLGHLIKEIVGKL
jgi:UDP-N-acetylglucosamine--N-acetylmuramyl-(pentapeptide) pyrophosphoryl-undecaprenol N-acetylglucosamine transferase